MTEGLDPRTPVIVGVGQSAERLGEPGYRGRSAVDMAADAARAALLDTGADPAAVAAAIDVVAATRQFENSVPAAQAPLGRSENFPRSVSGRVGADPARAILEITGGQSPQHLVNEFAAGIAHGEFSAALAVGAEAWSTVAALAGRDDAPDWTEHVDGQLEDRGYGRLGSYSQFAAHDLVGAPPIYALAENARRAATGMTREQYAFDMARLFAPFSRVAAANPLSAAPVERSVAELATPSPENRPISDPYLRYLVARDKVNQGAAVLVMSVEAAQRLGVPRERWVFLHGHADLRERDTLDRTDLAAAPAFVAAAEHALELAGIGLDDVACFDLYSCFPIAVFVIADALGLAADDPRGLTLTGGLPFFGGAGNNYSMHAIAEVVDRSRTQPGSFGFVGANGGTLSKYSVGVYSTTPVAWRADRSAALQEELDAAPGVPVAHYADGWATVETCTVRHGRGGARTGIVVGRLERDGRRFVARHVDGDDQGLRLLDDDRPFGQRIFVRSSGGCNHFALTRQRMDELVPRRPVGFRSGYDHIELRREEHLLEIVINRPDVRNCLNPEANDELDEVFDAFFADPELWVAIITGAGDRAFCAGIDLVAAASGRPSSVPRNGFAGLTSRPGMDKPVIAAVNGFAFGGGCELALACHLVVADERAQFALSEVRVGMVAGAGGLVRLPRTVPLKIANELILTGRRIGADEAHRLGLVNHVAAAGEAVAQARELAADILEASPTSVRFSLDIMNETAGVADTLAAVAQRSRRLDELMTTADAREGLAAFAQKRPPRWVNR
jgi:acetyl-CoA C-acetyltransferase